MATILLTGARAPATLELARHFATAGHRVLSADSVAVNPCRRSRSVAKNFVLPAPVKDFEGFTTAIADICQRESVAWVIPTCEEIFWVSRAKSRLERASQVLAPHLPVLTMLHSKWAFIEQLRELQIRVPSTWLLRSPDDLEALRGAVNRPNRLVFKPVYSRFASRVLFWQDGQAWPDLNLEAQIPWVAQAWVTGQGVCTYGVAHAGKLLAHAAYPVRFTAGVGACISFEALPDERVLHWVEQVVAALCLTGQFAFDLIIDADGQIFPLECNPRATSGVHLFDHDGALASALMGEAKALVTPPEGAAAMLGLAMGVYGLPAALKHGQMADWGALVLRARDAVWRRDDPWPMVDLALTFREFGSMAQQRKITIAQAMTCDIEWNGSL
ncbi:MAG: ATP-grasp domain-containing protein [Candidatus Sericytochromatia bacterium]|nr:ATP-grasp domain-containing protein [Candidatus Sericytochromatia bacterium]